MQHELYVLREHGFRCWLAYILVRIAHRLKDTTHTYLVANHDGTSFATFEGDSWGGGLHTGYRVVDEDHPKWGPPVGTVSCLRVRMFPTEDAALDYAYSVANEDA